MMPADHREISSSNSGCNVYQIPCKAGAKKESLKDETDDEVEFRGNVKGSSFGPKVCPTHRLIIFRYISYRVEGLNYLHCGKQFT
jgi:hypothetical protein